MGVTGLWRLIEPAGKPVPVETLENKVLAVDISIWLHQMVKGYQDAKGAPMPNAHLIGLFQRLCKLLYFRIKPVFVFDGGFPDLKKETIAKRQDIKSKYNSQSEKLKREIALLLGKKTAISALLGIQISPKKNKQIEDKDDMFKLPALPTNEAESESESDDEQNSSASTIDLHSVDLESDKFKNMPLKEKYDVLLELKETRKMNSWGKIHTLPKKSDNFSDFQMQRLLKRRKVQECLEETEKEMGDGGMSLTELESLLNEEGIDTKFESLPGRRIASNDTTRYLLISNVPQALTDAKQKEILKMAQIQSSVSKDDTDKSSSNNNELEDDLQKAIKMSLECVDEAETSACASKTDDSWTSLLTDSDYSDDEDNDFEQPDMSSAKAYIKQYSDFTYKAIDNIVVSKQKEKNKCKKPTADELVDEINREKTIIEDTVDLISSDEVIRDTMNNMDKSDIKNKSKLIDNTKEVLNVTDTKHTDLITTYKNDIQSNVNNTEVSIECLEDSNDEIISLDTSTHNLEVQNSSQTNIKIDEDSISSEDDFEEVPDSEQKVRKPVIQLTLNMGKEVEDDIFSDIFNTESNIKMPDMPAVSTSPAINEKLSTQNDLKTTGEDNIQKEIKWNEKFHDKIKVINHDGSMNVQIDKEKHEPSKDNVLPAKELSSCNINPNVNAVEIIEKIDKRAVPIEKLNTLVSEVENDLRQEKGRLDRIGRNITEQMTKEAQELLQVFGIPYIVAPMEAEAQCAFLENVKLTDGTITDDSDIWLFGGKTVYKNFFNQKKHVLQFQSERIQKSFSLSREQLVLLALLVGSDYTTGVTGVGPVTALEILASFPFAKKKSLHEESNRNRYHELITGLQDFKNWVKAGKRTDNNSLKKKLKNVNISDDFPSVRVVQAYMEPNVEKSEEKFTWGELDTTILRDYAKEKFGWSQNKLDEIIKPVLKRMIDSKSQKTIYDYFKRKIEFHSLEDQMSKRVKAAVQKMDPERPVSEVNDESDKQKTTRKRKIRTTDSSKSGPSHTKQMKNTNETKHIDQVIKSTVVNDIEKKFDINIPNTGRFQEIIPQREKDKQHLLENKLKAIELFRKTKIDRKKKTTKRKLPVPKKEAVLSESDSD